MGVTLFRHVGNHDWDDVLGHEGGQCFVPVDEGTPVYAYSECCCTVLIGHAETCPAADRPYPICGKDGCDSELFPPYDEEDRCESHTVDSWGVEACECDCYIGAADNTDVEVCTAHSRAWRARYKA